MSGQTAAGEIINKTKDGRLLIIDGSNNPILDETGTIIAFAPLSQAPWGVVIWHDSQELFAPVRRLGLQSLVLGLLAVAGALILVLLTTRLVYWQMVRGVDLLPLGLGTGGLIGGGRDPNQAIDSDKELKALLSGGGSLNNLQDLPQPIIQRITDQLATISRGSIYDRGGQLLAADRLDAQGNPVRYYNEPSLAHVIGSVSGLRIGISGLERSYNGQLLGLNSLDASYKRMLHLPVTGDDLVLTIDSALQRKAEEALKGRAGSITVLDAHTGAILAMASLPRFDPNRFLAPGNMVGRIQQFCAESGQAVPQSVGEITRCILESLALEYRRVVGQLETLSGRRAGAIHIVGGGSRNTLLNQLTADCTGREVVAGPVEATAIGNILVQAIALGHIPNLQAGRAVVRASFTPQTYNPTPSAAWEDAYARFCST